MPQRFRSVSSCIYGMGFCTGWEKLLADEGESCRAEPNYKIKSGYQPMYNSEAQICAIMATLPLLWPQRCRNAADRVPVAYTACVYWLRCGHRGGHKRSTLGYKVGPTVFLSQCGKLKSNLFPMPHLSIYLSKKSRLGRRKCRDTTRAPNNVN